jgi:small subunit ribosomal protein S17
MSRKKLTGTVVSDKMEKTVVVEVERAFHHPRYKKRVEEHKKYKAHDELGAAEGDQVIIEECPPISKDKHFKVIEINADS